jgi:hypothetical protein
VSESLWVRRKFFDSYGNRDNEHAAKLPPRGIRFTCPCCGYPTLAGRATFEICSLCWWEDDGQDDEDAETVRGGSNHHYSLAEARLNFEDYMVMYPPESDIRIGGPDSDEIKAIKRTIIAAFDQMMSAPPAAELDRLWDIVGEGESALSKDLCRLIDEHEGRPQI